MCLLSQLSFDSLQICSVEKVKLKTYQLWPRCVDFFSTSKLNSLHYFISDRYIMLSYCIFCSLILHDMFCKTVSQEFVDLVMFVLFVVDVFGDKIVYKIILFILVDLFFLSSVMCTYTLKCMKAPWIILSSGIYRRIISFFSSFSKKKIRKKTCLCCLFPPMKKSVYTYREKQSELGVASLAWVVWLKQL